MNAEKSWPHKSAAELAQIIVSAWGVPVIERDLAKPTPELVQAIHSAILLEVLSLDVQKFERDRQMTISESGVEYLELYYDPITLQMLLYHMGRVAKLAKVKTFTMRDLTRPDPVRTNRILSAVVNFMAFRDSRDFAGFLEKLFQRDEATRERYEERERAQDDLQDEYAEERRRYEEGAQLAKDVELDTQQLESELNTLFSEAHQLTEKTTAFRARKKECSDTLRELVTEREILVRSNAAERARIVRSPERLKQKNADLVESAEALKPQIAGVESTLKSHRAKMTTLYNVHNDVKDATKDLQLLEKESESLHIKEKEYHERWSMFTEKMGALNSSETMIQQADRQRQYALDKLQRMRATHEEKQEIAQRKHEDLQVRHQRLVKLRGERYFEHHAQKEETDKMAKEQEVYFAENQAEIDTLYTEYFKMARMIANYMFDLDKELDLQMFSNKHALASEDHKKHKKKRKAKTAPEPVPAE